MLLKNCARGAYFPRGKKGKTENIGVQSGDMINRFPKAIGFIASNTYLQLSQTTLKKAMDTSRKYYGWDEYDKNDNPSGFHVIDKKPPAHFRKFTRYGVLYAKLKG